MTTERLSMNKIREILRLRWVRGRTVRETARSLGVSTGVVAKADKRAKRLGLTWAQVEELGDQELEQRVYGPRMSAKAARPEPDPVWIDTELRKKGVTLELLHLEYLEQHKDGLRYTAFCERYRRWKRKQNPVMRQVHKAGDKVFVDFSGKRPHYVDPETGEHVKVELFVAVLGASNYTYVEATATQRLGDWIGANSRALRYFEGCPNAVVPDQLKSAVSEPSRYEPGVQRTFSDWARHYDTAVVPARPGKARDKAKAEAGVLVAQRWILARLRHETFFSLTALNKRIAELVEELNDRPMRKLGGVTRRELFERLERPALRPLPERPFEMAEWQRAKVYEDYHIAIDNHWYSVPHQLIGEHVEVRLTEQTVEAFHLGRRVASHARSNDPFKPSTDPAHRPPNHRAWFEKDPGGLIAWAKDTGPWTEAMMRRLLDPDNNFHHEVRWRSGRGLRRVGDQYGAERCEEACRRALRFGGGSYKQVARILKLGLDERELPDEEPQEEVPIEHDQVRGPDYYH